MAKNTNKIVGIAALLALAGGVYWWFRGGDADADDECSEGYILVNGECVPEGNNQNVDIDEVAVLSINIQQAAQRHIDQIPMTVEAVNYGPSGDVTMVVNRWIMGWTTPGDPTGEYVVRWIDKTHKQTAYMETGESHTFEWIFTMSQSGMWTFCTGDGRVDEGGMCAWLHIG